MPNQTNSFSSPLSYEIVEDIEQLNLSIIQKHHIRLLAHCLAILKEIVKEDISPLEEDERLREWCEKQSKKFNDENFNQLFYEQMSSASKKLNAYSQSIEKNLKELDLEDLILLVGQNQEN